MNLSPRLLDALRTLPDAYDGPSDNSDLLEQLKQLGLIKVGAQGICLTQRGAVEKVLQRRTPPSN